MLFHEFLYLLCPVQFFFFRLLNFFIEFTGVTLIDKIM